MAEGTDINIEDTSFDVDEDADNIPIWLGDTKKPVMEEIASLSVRPWRKTPNFKDKKKVRDELVEEVTRYKPLNRLFPSAVKFPNVNILLLGAVGAGKSSTFNTVISIFMNKIFRPASSGYSDHSLTNKVTKYPVRNRKNEHLNFKIWDMRGLEEKHFMTAENMKYILQGNVPDKCPLDPSGDVNIDGPGFKRSPLAFETIHCVAVVIDSSIVQTWDPSSDIVRNIRELQTVMNSLDVPVVGVLTKIDRLCQDTNSDVTNAYSSQTVGNCVKQVSDVLGLPKHSIYPIKNYEEETELDTNVDIVALLTLKGILDHCDAFLVNRYKHIVDNASLTTAIKDENANLLKTNESMRSKASTLQEQLMSNESVIDKLSKELYDLKNDPMSMLKANCDDLRRQIKRLDNQKAELGKEIEVLTEELGKLKEAEERCTQVEGQTLAEGFTSDEGLTPDEGLMVNEDEGGKPDEDSAQDEGCAPITVQLYCKRNDLLTGIEDVLTPQLTSRLKSINVDVVFQHIDNIADISIENPVLVLCTAASRLGTDVDNVLHGLNLNKSTLLLVFHHKEKDSLPNQVSSRVLTGQHITELAGMYDMAYVRDKGLYECDMNTSSLDKIVNFIQEVSSME